MLKDYIWNLHAKGEQGIDRKRKMLGLPERKRKVKVKNRNNVSSTESKSADLYSEISKQKNEKQGFDGIRECNERNPWWKSN